MYAKNIYIFISKRITRQISLRVICTNKNLTFIIVKILKFSSLLIRNISLSIQNIDR